MDRPLPTDVTVTEVEPYCHVVTWKEGQEEKRTEVAYFSAYDKALRHVLPCVGWTKAFQEAETSPEFSQALKHYTIKEVRVIPNIEGGLALLLEKGEDTKLVVLGYTELGEWVEYAGPVAPCDNVVFAKTNRTEET